MSDDALAMRAASRLDRTAPWVLLGSTPVDPMRGDAPDPAIFRRWIEAETSTWPAPIPFGASRPHLVDDRVTITGHDDPYRLAQTHFADFGPDGAAIVGLRLGSPERSADGGDVWAVGEGAVVWFVVAAARLLAAHGVACAQEAAVIRIDLLAPDGGGPLQLWNRRGGEHAPASPARTTDRQWASSRVELAECLGPHLPRTIRPLLGEFLAAFAVDELRHITEEGGIRAACFTGHDARVAAWAQAAGMPYEA